MASRKMFPEPPSKPITAEQTKARLAHAFKMLDVVIARYDERKVRSFHSGYDRDCCVVHRLPLELTTHEQQRYEDSPFGDTKFWVLRIIAQAVCPVCRRPVRRQQEFRVTEAEFDRAQFEVFDYARMNLRRDLVKAHNACASEKWETFDRMWELFPDNLKENFPMPVTIKQRCQGCHELKDRSEFASYVVKRTQAGPLRAWQPLCNECRRKGVKLPGDIPEPKAEGS